MDSVGTQVLLKGTWAPHMCVRRDAGDAVSFVIRYAIDVRFFRLWTLWVLQAFGRESTGEARLVQESTAFGACLVLRIVLPSMSRYSHCTGLEARFLYHHDRQSMCLWGPLRTGMSMHGKALWGLKVCHSPGSVAVSIHDQKGRFRPGVHTR